MQKLFKGLMVLGFVASGGLVQAQGFRSNVSMDAAFSAYKGEQLFALSAAKIHRFGNQKKLLLGYGLRYSFYLGANKNYVTAPAELTSGKTGPAVFFTENIVENMDSFQVSRAQHHGFNSVIYLGYQFNSKWSVMFNIDAFGFTLGPKVNGRIISDQQTATGPEYFDAKPVQYNVLLISDNDIGMLNSELYLQYKSPEGYGLRVGGSFLFTEYRTESPVQYNFNNDRFRRKSLMGMVAITWWPFEE